MGVKFTRESAQRIARVVQRVEGRPDTNTARRGSFGSVQFDYTLTGKTLATSAKGAMTNIAIYSGDAPDNLQATGEVVEAWNRFGTIQANRWVDVKTKSWGFEISAAEC